tara:strand:- start:12130 stop:12453 length:324 start_codon:yes stop_codon:yes gene_type:complete
MNWKKVIENALEMLEKGNNGIVLMDMYSNVLTAEEAAFNKVSVTPYNAKKFVEELFSQAGLDLKDKDLRMKLLKLILIMEEADANKSRKKKLDEVLEGYDVDFGKVI